MNVRPNVVALLAGLDLSRGGPDDWTHLDGTPLSPQERALAGSATRNDLQAVRDYAANVASLANERVFDMARIAELTAPHFTRFPDATMGEVVAYMSEPDRVEFLTIMDRIAPDGMIEIPE